MLRQSYKPLGILEGLPILTHAALLEDSPSRANPMQTNAYSIISSSCDAAKPQTNRVDVEKPAVCAMSLSELCDAIECDLSLQHAVIISSETYPEPGPLFAHRFVVLGLRHLDGKLGYLRLERRSDGPISKFGWRGLAGIMKARDEAQISASKELLITRGSIFENRQTLDDSNLTVKDLRQLLCAFLRCLPKYEVWRANCWSLVSIIQQYLSSVGCGMFSDGALKFTRLAKHASLMVYKRVERTFPLIGVLRSQWSVSSAAQADISHTIKLLRRWYTSGNNDTISGRTRAFNLSCSLQVVASKLDFETGSREICLLWEESLKILNMLSRRDPASYGDYYAVSLDSYDHHLHHVRGFESAVPVPVNVNMYVDDCAKPTRPTRGSPPTVSFLGASIRMIDKLGNARGVAKGTPGLQHAPYDGARGSGVQLEVFAKQWFGQL